MMQTKDVAVMARTGAVFRVRRGISRYGGWGLAKEATLRPLRPVLAPVAARRLSELAGKASTSDELLDLAFSFEAFGITIRPGQVRWEFSQLLEQVDSLRPRRILEIGTANGGSLLPITRLSASDAHIISVDLHHGEFGGGYPAWRIPLYKSFVREAQRLDLIRGDSHDPRTSARVRTLLGGEQLDFLFIDGDHTFDGVRQDFETYGPLVRPGGLIGFHDINPSNDDAPADGTRCLVGGVPHYWDEIKTRWDSQEFVAPWSARGCFGIGLIRV
jgi:predicted O-methyltransferase YrrM